ncbi:MAG: hypothetical protein R3E96_02450 [Planctomycetota bacterium]
MASLLTCACARATAARFLLAGRWYDSDPAMFADVLHVPCDRALAT